MNETQRTLREEKELWEGLLNHPKWQELASYAAAQQQARTVNVMNGLDSIREEDKQRGEVLGIGLFMHYPKLALEEIEVELDNLSQE